MWKDTIWPHETRNDWKKYKIIRKKHKMQKVQNDHREIQYDHKETQAQKLVN